MIELPIDLCKFTSCAAFNFSLQFCFFLFFLVFFFFDDDPFFFVMCAHFIVKNWGKRKLKRMPSRLGNCRSQYSAKFSLW